METKEFFIAKISDLFEHANVWTPKFLAEQFSELDSINQAIFFDELATFAKKWSWSDMQWRYMQDSLTEQAKELIDNIKAHTDK
jgi:hypothetical protein